MLELIHDKFCASKRDPVKTRETLLAHAYAHIHEHGFQAVSLDAILRDTGVTKGALYHHFPNKSALGYAVVEEVIAPMVAEFWVEPIVKSDDPVSALKQVIMAAGEGMTLDELKRGCPLNNLSQEMSPVDEEFRERIDAIYTFWRKSLVSALLEGQANGTVATQVDAEATAAFLIASLEGCIGMAKNAQSREILNQCGSGILNYLDSLRPSENKE